jgi:TusA-related sulfurtransferase
VSDRDVNLEGKLCPYVVVHILREVSTMQGGEACTFQVDDPLAIKSVPDELEDRDDLSISANRLKQGWEITISKA